MQQKGISHIQAWGLIFNSHKSQTIEATVGAVRTLDSQRQYSSLYFSLLTSHFDLYLHDFMHRDAALWLADIRLKVSS